MPGAARRRRSVGRGTAQGAAASGAKGGEWGGARGGEEEEASCSQVCLRACAARTWRCVLLLVGKVTGGAVPMGSKIDRKARRRAQKEAKKREREERERPLEIGTLQYFPPFVRGSAAHRFVDVDRPVAAGAVEVLFRSKRLLVVSKPAPMPINRSPNYYRANLRHILKKQLCISGRLSAIHRLDICTTGVVLLSTDKQATNAFAEKLRKRQVTKAYLALVKGSFPREPVLCDEPVDNKPSQTKFFRLTQSKNAKIDSGADHHSSLLLAVPVTGRKHQIRKHLAFLGFPILGDVTYQNAYNIEKTKLTSLPTAWEPKNPYSDGERGRKLEDMFKSALCFYTDTTRRQRRIENENVSLETLRAHIGPESLRPWKKGNVWTRPIALHAWMIAGKGSLVEAGDEDEPWCFKAPEPRWAEHDIHSLPEDIARIFF